MEIVKFFISKKLNKINGKIKINEQIFQSKYAYYRIAYKSILLPIKCVVKPRALAMGSTLTTKCYVDDNIQLMFKRRQSNRIDLLLFYYLIQKGKTIWK